MIIKGKAIENSAFVLLRRILKADGEPIVQDDISEIVMRVFTKAGVPIVPDGGTDPYEGTLLDPVDVIYDELQLEDIRWTVDDEGYNFAVVLDGSYLPESDKYQVEFKFTPTTGPAFYALYEITAINIWSE